MQKILIVEDDAAIANLIKINLETEGYRCTCAFDGKAGADLIEEEHFDLILLDIMLPEIDGYELLEYIKPMGTPVIFLTANDLERDELNGFDLGADDYITKPFSIQVLKRRVEAVLRRGTAGSDCFDDGFLRLDFQALTAARNGERLSITPNEYKLLRLLTANAGAVMTRRLLLEKLWDCDENFIDDHTLTVTMNRLRAKIEEEGHTYIRTVRGMGYIWTGAGK